MSPAAKQPPDPFDCCRNWMVLTATEREQWAWQVMHRFGHSRTTFSPETFAVFARIPVERTYEFLEAAVGWKWVWQPQKDIFVGRLSSRR